MNQARALDEKEVLSSLAGSADLCYFRIKTEVYLMSITYASIQVFSEEPISNDSERFASWSPGWQTLIPTEENRVLLTDPEASIKKARQLSRATAKTVLWYFLFDEDILSFSLFTEGKIAASYNSDAGGKNVSKVPALIGLTESCRKRLSKILTCSDTEMQTRLLEEFFGVKLLLFPEMLEEDPHCAECVRSDALFRQYEAETRIPTGKRAPMQVEQVYELDGVLSNADWHEKYHKYHETNDYLWVFQKHYWLYAKANHTGIEEQPVCFRDGKLVFITDEEMLQYGADTRHHESRNSDPRYEQHFYPVRLCFSDAAPQPYTGKTIRLPAGLYGLGFDGKDRFLLYNDKNSFVLMDEAGKLLAKQSVKGDIIDQDGDYLLTWEEKWDTIELNGRAFPIKMYGIIRIYRIFEK